MALVLEGLSIKQIAAAFGIGLQTAAKHRARLLAKMNVRSDAQLVQLVYSQEWNAV
jgi:DNA-binding CsgD family transcriptional regulator